MNRFLKKEWDNFEAPETVRLRARQTAWSRLERPRRTIAWGWPAAGLAAVSALLLLWIAWPADPPGFVVEPQLARLPVRLPGGAGSYLPDRATLSPEATRVAPGLTPAMPMDRTRRAAVDRPAAERPKRVVVRFQLPESGVQMIWIKDENFTFGGE